MDKKALEIMDERFGCDSLISIATLNGGIAFSCSALGINFFSHSFRASILGSKKQSISFLAQCLIPVAPLFFSF